MSVSCSWSRTARVSLAQQGFLLLPVWGTRASPLTPQNDSTSGWAVGAAEDAHQHGNNDGHTKVHPSTLWVPQQPASCCAIPTHHSQHHTNTVLWLPYNHHTLSFHLYPSGIKCPPQPSMACPGERISSASIYEIHGNNPIREIISALTGPGKIHLFFMYFPALLSILWSPWEAEFI